MVIARDTARADGCRIDPATEHSTQESAGRAPGAVSETLTR
jgi:hypothetical protein